MSAALEIVPQTRAVGAIVTRLDLRAPLAAATFEQLQRAFLQHHVLCLRGQQITPEQQLAFAARWGRIFVHPYVPSIEGHPGVMKVSDPHPITVTWHQDTTHSKTPPRMSLLLAREVPACGGDTLFANQHLAYDGLSAGLRRSLGSLRAVHKGTELAREKGMQPEEVSAVHPVACAHPETGRKGLFVNADYTKHFEHWTEAESRPLLEYLYAEACRPEYTWRLHWQPGDLVLWDNRSVQHRVVADVEKGERTLHRVTIQGDVPV